MSGAAACRNDEALPVRLQPLASALRTLPSAVTGDGSLVGLANPNSARGKNGKVRRSLGFARVHSPDRKP
jgi:hypothetical protein